MLKRKGFKIVTEPDYETALKAGEDMDRLICRVYSEHDIDEQYMILDFDLTRNKDTDISKVTVKEIETEIIRNFESEMANYFMSPTQDEIDELEQRKAESITMSMEIPKDTSEDGIYIYGLLNFVAPNAIKWGLKWRQRDKNLITDFDETEVTKEMIESFVDYYLDKVEYDKDGMTPNWTYPIISPAHWKYAVVFDTAIFGMAVERGEGWDVTNAFEDGHYAAWAVTFFDDEEAMNEFISAGFLYDYVIYDNNLNLIQTHEKEDINDFYWKTVKGIN